MTPQRKFLLKSAQKAQRARYWAEARGSQAVMSLLNLLPPERATNVLATLGENVGPLSSRHKLILDNLALAFPDMSDAERQSLAKRVWRNMARLAAEYIFLERLFDFDPEAETVGRIEVEGAEIFERIRDEGKPVIFFTGHTGNFELLPICAATFGLEVTALFRPPNNPYIAKRVLAARTTTMGHLVPSKAGAAAGLAKALDEGKSVGLLVDQKFARGSLGTFFGKPVRTNPLLPRLVRQFDCPVHPARCVRLPKNRFRLELEEAIALPRNADGAIDIDASAQMLNDIVERWVREYPDQWMWFHNRWDPRSLKEPRRRKPRQPKPAGASDHPAKTDQ